MLTGRQHNGGGGIRFRSYLQQNIHNLHRTQTLITTLPTKILATNDNTDTPHNNTDPLPHCVTIRLASKTLYLIILKRRLDHKNYTSTSYKHPAHAHTYPSAMEGISDEEESHHYYHKERNFILERIARV